MSFTFFNSLGAELIKIRRSFALWLVVGGAFFIPLIMFLAQILKTAEIAAENQLPGFWKQFFLRSWESMAVLLLPLGIVLATSLITQVEYKNNAWKQLHTTPQALLTIYLAKLTVVLLLMLLFFVLFNLGIWLSASLPPVFYSSVNYPADTFPIGFFLKSSILFYAYSLPIVILQYVLSLQFRNFLIPLGLGIALVVGSLMAIRWEHGLYIPFTYPTYYFYILLAPQRDELVSRLPWLATLWSVLLLAGGYIVYSLKKEKG